MHIKRFEAIHSREYSVCFNRAPSQQTILRDSSVKTINAPPLTRSWNEFNMMHVDTRRISTVSFRAYQPAFTRAIRRATCTLRRDDYRDLISLEQLNVSASSLPLVYMSRSSRYICPRSFIRDPRAAVNLIKTQVILSTAFRLLV